MKRLITLATFILCVTQLTGAMTPDQRKEYRDKLLEALPPVTGRGGAGADTFKQWVQRTDALPPDFDALPKVNGLPDPMKFFDGKRTVKTPADWKDRRAEILKLFIEYELGTIPPKPKLDQVIELTPEQIAAEGAAGGRRGGFGRRGGPASGPAADGQAAGPASAPAGRAGAGGGGGGGFGARGPAAAEGSITKVVDLKYGPNSAITQRVTVVIPPGNGPFPVLMGGQAGITSRGYISCSAPSNVDSPPDIGGLYPDYDWGSMAKCAWTTQMVVDYLYTLPQVDKKCIAITGYSRGGKYALISTALDERITACVAGSTGVGGVLPWRYGSEANVAESIESTTRMFPIWFAAKFRFFSGREDRLPVDGNLLIDLVAPRSVLMLYGLNDEVSNTWGCEEAYYDTHKLYSFLGVPDHISILRVDGPGKHHGANDPDGTNRWLDIQFGKSQEKWVNNFLFPWDWNKWKTNSKVTVDLSKYPAHAPSEAIPQKESILSAVKQMLGATPAASELEKNPVTNPGDPGIDDTPRWVIGRSIIEHGWTREQAQGIAARDIRFGPGKIRGDWYYKQSTPEGTKLPAVIFLHGNSYPLGYMWVYRMDPHPIIALANAGFAVLAYDQTGYGSRMNESASFYDKYPQWSQLGRMVEDVRSAVEAARNDPKIDSSKIYLFGYGTGGMVALHAAALDPNVTGVVSICGFTPMRTDTPDKNTGGIARFYDEKQILPRLGFFAGHENQIPYDYQELIATIAPRQVYVFAPTMDRAATPADVHAAVEASRKVYGATNASDKLVLDQPWDYFRLSGPAQDKIVAWMSQNMK